MIQDDSDWSCFISLCRKSRFLKIKKCGIFTLWAHYFVPNLQDRLILFHGPQQLVGNVAAKLKLVLRPRVYTQSVCNFPQWGCYLLHVMLLNIVSLYISTTVRMCHPSSGGYGVFHSGLRLFVVQGIQKEAVVSAVTQFIVARKVRNVRRKAWPKIPNTTAFFQLLQANADSSSSTLPYSHGGVSCPRTRWVCVCVFGRGLLGVFSFLAPSWPMRSWWSLSPLALRRWSLLSSAAHSQMLQECWWWRAMVCGHVFEPSPSSCPPLTGCERAKEKQGERKKKKGGGLERTLTWGIVMQACRCLKHGFRASGLNA